MTSYKHIYSKKPQQHDELAKYSQFKEYYATFLTPTDNSCGDNELYSTVVKKP